MAIYTPYFYIIQDIRNGMYYAGAKWGRGANPETFMVDGGYRTSSCTIKNLIADHGVGIFVIRKEYESTMIERYGVDNPMKSCEIRDKVKKTNMQRHGVENPSQLENVKQKKKQTLIRNHGNHPNKGRIVITDGINTMFCQKDEIPTGWWKGRPNSP